MALHRPSAHAIPWALAVVVATGCGGGPTPPAAGADLHVAPVVSPQEPRGALANPSVARSRGDGPAVDEGAATAALRRWVPPVPPFVPYTPGAMSAAVSACRAAAPPRDVAICLLRTRDAGAIADFLPIARSTRRHGDDDPMEGAAWVDDAGAVLGAGLLAAQTSTRELVAMVADPAPQTRAFGLAALTATLVAMGEGRVQLGAQQRAAELAIGNLCEKHLGEDDPDVLHQALNCLYRASHRSSAPAVAALAAYHRDPAVRASAAVAYTGVATRSPRPDGSARLDPRVAAAMSARLRAPIAPAASVHEFHAREWLCRDLGMMLARYTPGLGEVADVAARMIDAHPARPGPSRGCRELATRELTPPSQRKPFPRGAEGDDRHCEIAQSDALPTLELCMEGAAMGTDDARMSVAIRDRNGRDPGGVDHQLVVRFPVRIEPGQRSVLAETRWAQLGDTVRIGLVPIVQRGATPEEDARSLTVVVVDIARRTYQDVARTPWCRGCDGVATRSGRGELEVTELRGSQKAQITAFRWDGTRLRLE